MSHVRVAVVGSGFAGIGTALRLLAEGERDFVILERSDRLGGVWRDNTYPGCACDVQSHLYSLSFAPNPSWTAAYAGQAEILAYLERTAREGGVLPHLRFGHEVLDASWDAAAQRWRLVTSRGPLTAEVLVAATGALSEPGVPDLPGLDRFRGRWFHSARWDHGYDLAGKRVAVVGTGASAIQLVPAIQPEVAKLHLFQRTPPWILPRNAGPIGPRTRALLASSELLRRALRLGIYVSREALLLGFRDGVALRLVERAARRHLAREVRDPALRARLTPSYRFGCKRVLLTDDYLPAVTRPNVEVIASPVVEVRPGGVVAAGGEAREVDAIVFATGFQVTTQPIARRVRGRDGRTLEEAWGGSPKAHLGTTVAGFPNLFVLQGPNTGLGHTSVLVMIEAQIEHALLALRHLRRRGAAALEPRPEVQAAFVREVDEGLRGTVWNAGGCASWYLDATGRNSTIWPGPTWTFRRRLASFDPDEYTIERGREAR